ncbi:MAG: pilus assembly FimT family protein [Patescibacteria group bacterium]
MLNRLLKKSFPAFSIIEMLVSIAIITLISTMFVANYQGNVRRSDLVMSANILAADTRLAQSFSLGLMKYDNVFPDGGWGMDFSIDDTDVSKNDRYYLYADGYDQASNQVREDNESLPEYKGKTVIFPSDIKIKSMNVHRNGVWQTTNHVSITFVPPKPQTIINDVMHGANCDIAIITLVNTRDDSTTQVMINFVGLIDVLEKGL